MMIVRDINDATTMKNKLFSLARRAHNMQKTRTQIVLEILDICDDLEKNIQREESLIEEEAFLKGDVNMKKGHLIASW